MKDILWWLTKLALLANFPTEDALKATVDASPMPNANEAIKFYLTWGDELHLSLGWFHSITGWLENGILKTLCWINQGANDIFNKTFELLGWEGSLSQSSSPLHGLYVFFNVVGWSLMAFSLMMIAFQSLGHNIKWGKILPNVLMVAITMTILPYLMRTVGGNVPAFGNIAQTARNEVSRASSKEMSADLAVQPFKNNIIDLGYEIRKNWKDDPAKTPTSELNGISTVKDVQNTDFESYMDKDTLEELQLSKKNKEASEVMNYHLNHEAGAGYILAKNHNGLGGGSGNDEVYARYSVNWFGVFGESIMIAAMFLIASLKIVRDTFELSILNVVAPMQAYRALRQPKVLRDLINSMIGLYLSFVLMMATFKMAMVFVSVAPSIAHFNSMVKQSIFTIIIYIGVIYGMLAGVAYFEKMTGVTQSHSEEVGHMMAVGAVGAAAAGLATKGVGQIFGNKNDSSNGSSGGGNTVPRASNTGNSSNAQGIYDSDNNSNSSQNNESNTDQNENKNTDQNNTHDNKQNQENNQNNNGTNKQDTQQNSEYNTDNKTSEEGHGIGETDDSDTLGKETDSQENSVQDPQKAADQGHGINEDQNNINSDQPDEKTDGPNNGVSEKTDSADSEPQKAGQGIGETADENISSESDTSNNGSENGHGIEDNDQDNKIDDFYNGYSSDVKTDDFLNDYGDSGSGIETDGTNNNSDDFSHEDSMISGPDSISSESYEQYEPDGQTENKENSSTSEEPEKNFWQRTGETMNKGSVEYLKNHRFNVSSSGHLHGRESDRFDDE